MDVPATHSHSLSPCPTSDNTNVELLLLGREPGLPPARVSKAKSPVEPILEDWPEIFKISDYTAGVLPPQAPEIVVPYWGPQTFPHPAFVTPSPFSHTWFLSVGQALEGASQYSLSSQGCLIPQWPPWAPQSCDWAGPCQRRHGQA